MSMITDRIGQHELLLPINQNYDKIWDGTRHLLYVFMKKKTTTSVTSAKCKTTARAHDAFCPLT